MLGFGNAGIIKRSGVKTNKLCSFFDWLFYHHQPFLECEQATREALSLERQLKLNARRNTSLGVRASQTCCYVSVDLVLLPVLVPWGLVSTLGTIADLGVD